MPKATVVNKDELPLMLRIKDVQQIIGCSKDVAYGLTKLPNFPALRLGGIWRVPRDRFLAWLEEGYTCES